MKTNFLSHRLRRYLAGSIVLLSTLTLVYCYLTLQNLADINADNPGFMAYCCPTCGRVVVENVVTPFQALLALLIDGQDCGPSIEDDPVGVSMGAAVAFLSALGGGSHTTRLTSNASAATSTLRLQTDYPSVLPLPFPALFPAAALSSYSMACTSNTSIYSVNHLSGTVSHISTCPPALVKKIPVCAAPLQVAMTPDAATAVVSCYDNQIAFIDTATDTVTTLATPNYNPNGVAISPDGTVAYFTSYINNPSVIFMVNLATRKLMPQTLTVNAFPKSIFLTPDGAMAWVLFYQSSAIYVIDTLSMTVAGTVNAGGQADTGMAFTPDGTRAYVSVYGGSVSVFNTATLAQIASIPVGDQPTNIVVTNGGSRAYVSSFSSNNPVTSVINTATNQVISTIPQKGPAMGLVIFH
jgi:YVTN family beta-propeller protein